MPDGVARTFRPKTSLTDQAWLFPLLFVRKLGHDLSLLEFLMLTGVQPKNKIPTLLSNEQTEHIFDYCLYTHNLTGHFPYI